jgi:mRNA interferase ChpB
MNRGDIYVVSLDPAVGREQRGYRPVVIISLDEFNLATGAPITLPITTGGEFARRRGFTIPLTGIQTTGVIRCDQPRAIDIRARNGRKVDMLPREILDEVLTRFAAIFEFS